MPMDDLSTVKGNRFGITADGFLAIYVLGLLLVTSWTTGLIGGRHTLQQAPIPYPHLLVGEIVFPVGKVLAGGEYMASCVGNSPYECQPMFLYMQSMVSSS